MNAETRRAVAFIAGSLVSGQRRASVYDYSVGHHTSFSGQVGERVSVYDYDAGCHISGNLPSLYHYGASAHLTLKVVGTKFNGYDYATSSHFNGTVRGRSISLYDYGEAGYFNYTV